MTTLTKFKIDQLKHSYNFYKKNGMPSEALKFKMELDKIKPIAKTQKMEVKKAPKIKVTITTLETTQEIELNNEIEGYTLFETVGSGKVVYKLKKLGYEAFMKAKKQNKKLFTDYVLYLQND